MHFGLGAVDWPLGVREDQRIFGSGTASRTRNPAGVKRAEQSSVVDRPVDGGPKAGRRCTSLTSSHHSLLESKAGWSSGVRSFLLLDRRETYM